MAVEELLEREKQEISPESELSPGPVFYVERELEDEEISVRRLEEELQDLPDSTSFFVSPYAFAKMVEERAGKHQPHLYDMAEDEVPDTPELYDHTRELVEETAQILVDLPAGAGRIDAELYEREGDPQYIRTHEGKVSGQVFEHFWKALPPELEPNLKPTREGYIVEFNQ